MSGFEGVRSVESLSGLRVAEEGSRLVQARACVGFEACSGLSLSGLRRCGALLSVTALAVLSNRDRRFSDGRNGRWSEEGLVSVKHVAPDGPAAELTDIQPGDYLVS